MSSVSRSGERIEALLAPIAAAAIPVFVLVGIGRSIWLDEANSISIASANLPGIIERLKVDNNFPVYYIILHFWMMLFGDSEAAVRLLSGICYAGATATVYFGAQRLFHDRRAALYAGFCYLASTQAIHHAQNVRMYALLGLLSAASTVLFCGLFFHEERPPRWWIWYVALNSVGALTHLWYAFVMMGQFAAIVLWRRGRLKGFVGAGVLSLLPFLALWSPVLWAQLHNGATQWMPPFKPIFIAHALLDFYGGPAGLLFYLICGMLIWKRGPAKSGEAADAPPVRVLLTCFVVTLATPLLISFFKPIYWPGRYTVIALPALALVLGPALARSAAREVVTLFCYAVLGLVLAAHIATHGVNSESGLPENESDQSAAQFIMRAAKPGDILIFTSLSRAALDYYLHRAHAESRFTEIGFPAENSVHLGWGSLVADGQRRPELQAEAAADVSRMTGLVAGSGARAWLLYGGSAAVTEILKNEMDQRLHLERRMPLVGPYYKELLEYAAYPR